VIVVIDESSIEIDKTKESLKILHSRGLGPVPPSSGPSELLVGQ